MASAVAHVGQMPLLFANIATEVLFRTFREKMKKNSANKSMGWLILAEELLVSAAFAGLDAGPVLVSNRLSVAVVRM